MSSHLRLVVVSEPEKVFSSSFDRRRRSTSATRAGIRQNFRS